MKVCVIDSGIDTKNEALLQRLQWGASVCIDRSGKLCIDENDVHDETGHGTSICNIILNHCNDLSFYIIKIRSFVQHNKPDEKCLIEALRFCKDLPCDLINISLGVRSISPSIELYEICKCLSDQGKLLICSTCNKGTNIYFFPAFFDCVIGVASGNHSNPTAIRYLENRRINLLAYGLPQLIVTDGMEELWASGASFATAHATGVIAKRAISKNINLTNHTESVHFLKSISDNTIEPLFPFQDYEYSTNTYSTRNQLSVLCSLSLNAQNQQVDESMIFITDRISLIREYIQSRNPKCSIYSFEEFLELVTSSYKLDSTSYILFDESLVFKVRIPDLQRLFESLNRSGVAVLFLDKPSIAFVKPLARISSSIYSHKSIFFETCIGNYALPLTNCEVVLFEHSGNSNASDRFLLDTKNSLLQKKKRVIHLSFSVSNILVADYLIRFRVSGSKIFSLLTLENVNFFLRYIQHKYSPEIILIDIPFIPKNDMNFMVIQAIKCFVEPTVLVNNKIGMEL
jgi:hypothetical protein